MTYLAKEFLRQNFKVAANCDYKMKMRKDP